jgi:pilus assembly protein CpaE
MDSRAVLASKAPRHEPRWTLFGRRQSEPGSAEQGQTSLELLGVVPIALLLVAIIWQLGLWGVTATYTSHAADEAARSAGIGATTADMREDALRSVPSWFRDNMDVSQTALGTIKVTSSMPVLVPVFTIDGLELSSETPIVAEEG